MLLIQARDKYMTAALSHIYISSHTPFLRWTYNTSFPVKTDVLMSQYKMNHQLRMNLIDVSQANQQQQHCIMDRTGSLVPPLFTEQVM